MIQQINLYQGVEQHNNWLIKNPYALITLAVCALLLILTGLNWRQFQQKQIQHQQLEQQLQTATILLQQLQARYPKHEIDTALIQQIQSSQQLYQSLSQITELLADDQSDQAHGFSRYFTALAEQTDRDVWLTRIQIDNTVKDISLYGSTFKPEQIPTLLKHLENSPAFKGRHFARLSIQQTPDKSAQTDFSVSSNLKSDSEVKHANQ